MALPLAPALLLPMTATDRVLTTCDQVSRCLLQRAVRVVAHGAAGVDCADDTGRQREPFCRHHACRAVCTRAAAVRATVPCACTPSLSEQRGSGVMASCRSLSVAQNQLSGTLPTSVTTMTGIRYRARRSDIVVRYRSVTHVVTVPACTSHCYRQFVGLQREPADGAFPTRAVQFDITNVRCGGHGVVDESNSR